MPAADTTELAGEIVSADVPEEPIIEPGGRR
jgi:hypothetical protein